MQKACRTDRLRDWWKSCKDVWSTSPTDQGFAERWFMAFQDAFEEIAKDPELTLELKTYCFTCTVN